MHPWLAAVRHDLVKRAVWPARDQLALGRRDSAALRDGLLRLADDEGRDTTALQLFAHLRRTAHPGSETACAAFESALARAVETLAQPWPAPLHAVLALEPAFDALARAVERK
jgi:hypothetical protein